MSRTNEDRNRDAKLVERPFVLSLSEHDLRHVRVILKRWAIEQKDWAQVRCAVGIYERINEQLSEETKMLLSGPPKPERDRQAAAYQERLTYLRSAAEESKRAEQRGAGA